MASGSGLQPSLGSGKDNATSDGDSCSSDGEGGGEDSPEGQAEGPLPRRPPRNRPYACTFCPKKFPKQGKLLKHLDLHKKHLFQCDVCFILFPSQEQLDKHKPSHICSTCGAVCFSRNKLRAHRREAHGTPYECQKCGKGFMDRRTRNRHQQSCVV